MWERQLALQKVHYRDRVETFLQSRREKGRRHATAILDYIAAQQVIRGQSARARDLVKALTGPKKAIRHETSLFRALEAMVKSGVLEMRKEVERTDTTRGRKEKTNTYYRIPHDLPCLATMDADSVARMYAKLLEERRTRDELNLRFEIAINLLEKCGFDNPRQAIWKEFSKRRKYLAGSTVGDGLALVLKSGGPGFIDPASELGEYVKEKGLELYRGIPF